MQGAASSLHMEGGGIMFLLKFGTHLPDCMVSLCKWPLFESSIVNTSNLITAISAWVYHLVINGTYSDFYWVNMELIWSSMRDLLLSTVDIF